LSYIPHVGYNIRAPAHILLYVMIWPTRTGLRTPATPAFFLKMFHFSE
jgi:hypothetical protein